MAAFGRSLSLIVFLLSLVALTATCRREVPPPGPQPLLQLKSEDGPAQIVEIDAPGGRRRGLGASARYRLFIPRASLLVFSLAASARSDEAARGFLHLRVRVDGRAVGERRINVRTERGLRSTHVSFDGPGRTGLLELELGIVRASGEPLPAPPDLVLAAVDPVLLDVSTRGDRRGVVLISIDTLRRDHVGLYGYPKPTTPNLDALGREGLVFDDVVSVSSWTLPAHFSMVTSVEPAAHGAIHSKRGFNRRVPTLARTLRDAGFTTHAITSHLYLSPEYGFDDGFDDMDYRYDRKGLEVAERAFEFIDRVDERPFFLFLHFYDPHLAYAPSPEILRTFEEQPYTGTISGSWWKLKTWTKETTSPTDLAHLLALYDGEIRYTDGQVNHVLRRMREKGLQKRTLVVVTSDHGEEFLEHAGWEHQRTLYEEVLRIPLLFHGPGIPRGQRVSEQVSLLDVTPTILDWVGLPPLPTQRGRSLLQPVPKREAYGETDHGLGDTRKLFLRGGADSWKAILTFDRRSGAPTTEEWYDLRVDPGESRVLPVPANASAIRTRLLQRWREASRQGVGGVPVDLSPEQIEQLRALGYIQ